VTGGRAETREASCWGLHSSDKTHLQKKEKEKEKKKTETTSMINNGLGFRVTEESSNNMQ
jgi:hypothetical protein